jgi:hypothetical protein
MNIPTRTPRTDAATYPADCLGKTLVTNRDCSRALETELSALTAERDQLRAVFPLICAAIGNGACCKNSVSLGFIQSIPNEVQLVVDQLRSDCENETKWAAHYLADSIASKAEREQLRAEVERLKKQIKDDNRSYGCELRDPNGTIWEQATKDHARAKRAEAAETVALAQWNGALERAMKAEAERDHLHAQLRALTLICGTNDANKFETWVDRANARAERAEAELAAERARLDWVFRNCKVTADDFTTGNRDVYAIHDREDLGAAMKEGVK